MAFSPPRSNVPVKEREREVLRLWKEERVFERSLEKNRGRERFVFYEGPPTANGLPHNGHVLTRVVKDLFPRFKSMRGFDVPRKGGWDTHGLPVEVEVEKELGIHGKGEIESYGVEPFTRKCIESVFRYTEEWEKLTEKIGFWLDMDDAYVTYHKSYVESVWWALSRLFEKKLLYRGKKSVWWWPQGGTALSSGEVGLGYREVDDPEVVIRFKSQSRPGHSYLAWTTTPWTLPSNVALAVSADLEYCVVRTGDEGKEELAIVAAPLVEKAFEGRDHVVVETLPGRALVGERYEPLFDYAEPEGGEHHLIVEADFVGADQGTGIVHIAPGFGEDDFRLSREAGLGFLQLLKPDGTFPDTVPELAGDYFKVADKKVIRMLKERGLLFRQGQYRHDYPFCWRASSDPLIQYARPCWFIKTTEVIGEAIANNREVAWLPEHIKEGRFGDFLANNVDWALSRERFWGTPLPVWTCGSCGADEAFARLDDVLARNPAALDHWEEARRADPELSEHLVVHKPWVDAVTVPCASCGGTMTRVPDVVDCWFDSGCMPFAQFGFPHRGREEFASSFPADFISEAIDQTRGWFYSLLMISTLVFDRETQDEYAIEPPVERPHPYRSCIVLGHVCDPDGKKESKSSGNYTPPDLVLDGAFRLTAADVDGDGSFPEAGEAMLLPAQVKTLGLEKNATLTLRSCADAERTAQAVVKGGKAPKESIVLGAGLREALGVAPGDPVEIAVTDEPPGADAFRWFFLASGPPWNNTRNSLRSIREEQSEFLVRWQNVLSFFQIYASIDGFDPAVDTRGRKPEPAAWRAGGSYPPVSERPLLDRWILSELALTERAVVEHLESFRAYEASQALKRFVDGLSNWYVRRSRPRFWAAGDSSDKAYAFWTLWESLATLAQISAPFVPFFSDHSWRTLVGEPWPDAETKSVHLTDWPETPEAWIDRRLSETMALAREAVSLGLSARGAAKIRVRQPLRRARLLTADPEIAARLDEVSEVIGHELNVQDVAFGGDADRYVHWIVKPNFRVIGPRHGKLVPQIKKALAEADAASLKSSLEESGEIEIDAGGDKVTLARDEIEVSLTAREHYAASSSPRLVVVLETDIDESLARGGLARELINRIQTLRKEADLDYTDRIRVSIEAEPHFAPVLEEYGELIAEETLATEIATAAVGAGCAVKETVIDGATLRVGLEKVE